MREVLALITFILLVRIGWHQSFEDHFSSVVNGRSAKRVLVENDYNVVGRDISAAAPPKRDNSWMWRKSKLDNPHN
jgi:hypothetical protein